MPIIPKNTPLDSYPWYVSDWRGSRLRVQLSSLGRGLFRELLDYCWEVGSLPLDERTLITISGATKAEFRREWPIIQAAFYQEDGAYKHHKVEECRPKLVHFRCTRISNARAPRVAKASAHASAPALAPASGGPSLLLIPTVPSEPPVETPPPPRVAREPAAGPDPQQLVADAVEVCAQFWPNVGDKRYARSTWEREAGAAARGVAVWCEAIVLTARKHAPAQIAAKTANARHFIPTLDRWVSSGDYTSPPPKVIRQERGPVDLGENLDG